MEDIECEILWMSDNMSMLKTGVCMINNEKFWFKGTDEGNEYEIYKIDDDILKEIEDEHEKYCEITGMPKKHGDPFKLKSRSGNFGTNILKYEYKRNTIEISGELKMKINKNCFKNMNVPHKIE